MNKLTPQELDWLAFRYIAGELNEREQIAFEERLAEDLAAGDVSSGEALARAVELSDATRAAYKQTRPVALPATPHPWRLRLTWLAGGAVAAAALIAIAVPEVRHIFTGPGLQTAASPLDPRTGALAVAWSEVGPAWSATVGDEAAPTTDESASETGDEVRPAAAPSWMLAAVRGLSSDSEENDMQPERAYQPDGGVEN